MSLNPLLCLSSHHYPNSFKHVPAWEQVCASPRALKKNFKRISVQFINSSNSSKKHNVHNSTVSYFLLLRGLFHDRSKLHWPVSDFQTVKICNPYTVNSLFLQCDVLNNNHDNIWTFIFANFILYISNRILVHILRDIERHV